MVFGCLGSSWCGLVDTVGKLGLWCVGLIWRDVRFSGV